MTNHPGLSYRPDIDGLRAIAVLAVIIFHIHPDFLRGGFAGVDIFFVISGFLITSILRKDLDDNKFSLAQFYERRARRILPALITVLTITLGVFSFIFFPADLVELGQSTIAAALSVSNIFFWRILNYFATAATEKPLLHTWSLGVEEQFYLIFPILLFYLDRYFPAKKSCDHSKPTGPYFFYLRHLCGLAFFLFRVLPIAIAFFGNSRSAVWSPISRSGKFSSKTNNAVSIAGLAMVASAYIFYTDKIPFPGIGALLPCIGAASLIFAGPHTYIGQKILGNRPAILTGKMSYSLYLWHWPLLVLARYCFEHPGKWIYLGILVATFILGYLSWRLVETPFRRKNFMTRRSVFIASLAAIALIVTASLFLIIGKGFPDRFSPKAFALAQAAYDYKGTVFQKCVDPEHENESDCFFGATKNKKTEMLLWGDSHAGAMNPLLDAFATSKNLKGVKMTKSSCPAMTGIYKWKSDEIDQCREFNDKVLAYVLAHKDIKYIVMAARWAPIAKTIEFANSSDDAFYKALHHTVETLHEAGRQVFIIAAVPEIRFNVPRCLSHREAFGGTLFDCQLLNLEDYREQQKLTLPAFSALQEDAPVLYPHMTLCKDGTCHIMNGEDVLYFDDDHLSTHGALTLLPSMKEAFPIPAGH